jgi:uncharacterized protein (DUF2249 family)
VALNFETDEPGVRFWLEEGAPARGHLDVREMLQEGGEPYGVIMECVSTLEAGQSLVVHAIMQPRPLIQQLGRMGYAPEVRHAGPDHWEVEVREG